MKMSLQHEASNHGRSVLKTSDRVLEDFDGSCFDKRNGYSSVKRNGNRSNGTIATLIEKFRTEPPKRSRERNISDKDGLNLFWWKNGNSTDNASSRDENRLDRSVSVRPSTTERSSQINQPDFASKDNETIGHRIPCIQDIEKLNKEADAILAKHNQLLQRSNAELFTRASPLSEAVKSRNCAENKPFRDLTVAPHQKTVPSKRLTSVDLSYTSPENPIETPDEILKDTCAFPTEVQSASAVRNEHIHVHVHIDGQHDLKQSRSLLDRTNEESKHDTANHHDNLHFQSEECQAEAPQIEKEDLLLFKDKDENSLSHGEPDTHTAQIEKDRLTDIVNIQVSETKVAGKPTKKEASRIETQCDTIRKGEADVVPIYSTETLAMVASDPICIALQKRIHDLSSTLTSIDKEREKLLNHLTK